MKDKKIRTAPRPQKEHSQNFLINANVKNRIINACDLSDDETICEIGPGKGALTEILVNSSKHVYAVEKDPRLCNWLTQHLHSDRLTLINEDFLLFELSRISGDVVLIGNIPYHISSPIIEKIIAQHDRIKRCYLTVQLEFGKRLCAKDNTKEYGSLSCFTQYYLEPKILFKIPNTCFQPMPKVHSCLVKLMPRRFSPIAKNTAFLFALIQAAFQQRRKKILNALSALEGKDALRGAFTSARINPNVRAENISLEQYVKLAGYLTKKAGEPG